MRKPTPKKLTSTENEKIRTIRNKNTEQNQENTYARQYPKPKENRAERFTRRAALAGQVPEITSAWIALTPWVSAQKVFEKNKYRPRRHHNKSGSAEGTRTKSVVTLHPSRAERFG